MSIPVYLQIIAGTMQEGMTADRKAHQRIHDHLAGVMDDAVKPIHGQESARFRAAAGLDEAGKAIAQKHAARLAAAHDEAARQMGMDCEGGYNDALGIPTDSDQDAPDMVPDYDNDGESASKKKGKKIMTEAEMMQLLKDKGYNVAPPKTADQQLAEMRTQMEEQQRQLQALLQQGAAPTQRQTQAPSAMQETYDTYQPEPMYQHGDYLATSIHPRHWNALAGNGVHQRRNVPWPKDADPDAVIAEMAPIMAYDLLMQEANTMRRDINTFIGVDERV